MAGRSETTRCAVRSDLKTIADFHRDDVAVFYAVFRQFNLTDRDLGVFGGEVTAIDGITLKAINNGAQLGHREVARLAGMASTRGSRSTFPCRTRATVWSCRWPTADVPVRDGKKIHRPVLPGGAPGRARKRPDAGFRSLPMAACAKRLEDWAESQTRGSGSPLEWVRCLARLRDFMVGLRFLPRVFCPDRHGGSAGGAGDLGGAVEAEWG